MKTLSAVKAGVGGGAALLLAGFLTAAPAAQAGTGTTVPCDTTKLIAAITAANTAGGGTINLARGCHYALKSPENGENGLPVIKTRITVNGNRATIDGKGKVRVLEVDGPGGNLSLQDVTITGGSADIGGGIENAGGTVTLNHSRVTGNTATQAGGGIASAASPSSVAKLTLNNSEVTGNRQTLVPTPQGGGLGGGGIANVLGTVTLDRSEVSGNTAMGFAGGGIASGDYMDTPPSNPSSSLTLNGSQVDGNTAPNAGGGGIQNLLGTAILNSSQVDGNTSLNGGGISSGNGNGGVPPGTSQLALNKSEVDGNTAIAPIPPPPAPGQMSGPPIAAGGIANGGNAVLSNSEVDHNTAKFTSGAGIVNHGTMTLNKSEVNGNTAAGSGVDASGGGILTAQGMPTAVPTTLTLNNSQVNYNRAGGDGGGIANGAPVTGPVPLPGGAVTLNHSQVKGNTAGIGGGGGIFNNGGTVTLTKTSITGNNPDNCEPPGIAGCKN